MDFPECDGSCRPDAAGSAGGRINFAELRAGSRRNLADVAVRHRGQRLVGPRDRGTGSFEEALLLITWMQFIFVVLQVVQSLAFIFFPVVAGLIGIVALGLFFWLLTNFIAVLHGFSSLGLVLVGIIGSAIGIVMGLSLVLAILGVTVPGI